ncbi:MAG: hypothetical protein WC471_05395 [Candidatus Woesearchaeota archaeon]
MNKKGFVWYLFQEEMIYMTIGIVVGVIVGYLMITDVIQVSQYVQLCASIVE